MRAGDVFMNALEAEGVSCIFGNPGTTENSILDRLVDHPGLSYYTTLHEGVAVAAATFHAMATGIPAVVNLHVAPGLGNAIGLMFGALKAGAPLVVTAGQQDTRMRLRQTLFSHDLVGMAAPVTKWSAEPRHGDEVAALVHRAFEIAREPPCGPVFLSLPVDVMEHETSMGAFAGRPKPSAGTPDAAGVEDLADLLRSARCPAIVVGDDVATDGAVATVVELAERIGACTYREIMHARMAFPTVHPSFRGRLPFDARNIRAALAAHDMILLVGGQFFEEMWFEEGSPIPHTTRVARIEASRERLTSSYRLDVALVGGIAQTLGRLLEVRTPRPCRRCA
jgi:benzoylformate decarboxylase